MGGIVGLYKRDGTEVDPGELRQMAATMPYRAQAGLRTWHGGSAGLGLLLSHDQGLTDAQIPNLAPQATGLVIAADVRLDNRADLISQLNVRTDAPDDAALISAAYRRWGETAPAHLLGDFAYTIWDPQEHVFSCARDHFGIKQLYYYCSPQLFAFASEIKALLASTQVPVRLNEARLADLLANHTEDKEATLYDGIRRLPPASSLRVGPHNLMLSTYWRLEPGRELRLSSDGEYAEAFRHYFMAAVAARLRGDGPVGTLLSGGLDSSAVTGAARELLGADSARTLHSFSAVYPDLPQTDERSYINAVLADGNIQPHFIDPGALGPLTDWDADTAEDEPLWNPQLPMMWAIYDTAKSLGLRLLLDGIGGDYVVGYGGPVMREWAKDGRLIRLAIEARWVSKRHGGSPFGVAFNAAAPSLPEPLRRFGKLLKGQRHPTLEWSVPLRDEFKRRQLPQGNGPGETKGVSARLEQWRTLTSGADSTIRFTYIDRLAARMGLETRCPFFDRRLVEFCLAVPPEQKLRHGYGRWIARNALAGVLPEEVRWRATKTGYGRSFDWGLAQRDRQLLEDILIIAPGPLANYVDIAEVQAQCRRYIEGTQPDSGFSLWRVASLGRWLRRSGLSATK